jgi:periplasmic divalent cation tolerance protein
MNCDGSEATMTDAIVVMTTTASRDEATKIATALVERQLAACVQIVGPIASVYRWQGRVEQSEEWLCVVKTQQTLYTQLELAIRELHSYDVPEIIGLPVVEGSESYLTWLSQSVRMVITSHDN